VSLREVPEPKVWERPPSTLRNINDGSPGGSGAEGLGAPTINAKKRRRWAPLEAPELKVWEHSACGAHPSGKVVMVAET
jgi:hypothetical protein